MWKLFFILCTIFNEKSVNFVIGQFDNCDYFQKLRFGDIYIVLSTNYPEYYEPSTNCRYAFVAPYGHKIELVCNDFDLPNSLYCMREHFSVSESGRTDLLDGHRYCGRGQFRAQSKDNRLVFGLRSGYMSRGGRFACSLVVKADDCECGKKKSTKIVGGIETLVNEYPMMSGLVDINLRQVFCGATLISDYHAVTAAHCLTRRRVDETGFLVGDHALNTGNDTTYAALYMTRRFIIHENYTSSPVSNDIGLIETEKNIEFNEGVSPVCLPWRFLFDLFVNETIEACGWGAIEFGGPTSNTLMKVDLDVVDNEICSRRLPDVNINQICTYAPNKDTCQSDSGGPLFYVYPTNGLVYNIGLVSYGVACATEIPSVSTRITSYLDWIIEKTPTTFYCYK